MPLTTENAWETFHIQLKQFILNKTHDEALVDDVLQEVFLKIHTHIDTLKDQQKLAPWLYQIARHTIYDYYRQQKRAVALPENFDIAEELPELDVSQALLPCVKTMVESLPDPYREALFLTEYQGMTQKELAEHRGLSLSGAKSRVQRAREKLKTMLLDCCHFELDRRGKIISYHPRHECSVACSNCCD